MTQSLKSRRWLKRCAWALVWLVTAMVLFYAAFNWAGQRSWNQIADEYEKRGEPLTAASITPPSIPDESNFFAAPIFAGGSANPPIISLDAMVVEPKSFREQSSVRYGWEDGYAVDLNDRQKAFRKVAGLVGEQSPKIESLEPFWKTHFQDPYWKDSTKSAAEDVLAALSVYNETLEQVRQAAKRPGARSLIDYDRLYATGMNHLRNLTNIARLTSLRASAEFALKQPEQAFEDMRLALHVFDSLKTEPTLISLLVRFSILNIHLQPLWEGVTFHHLDETQLEFFEDTFAQMNCVADFEVVLRGERIFGLTFFQDASQHREIINQTVNPEHKPKMSQELLLRMIPSGLFQFAKVGLVRTYEGISPALDSTNIRIDKQRCEQWSNHVQETFKPGFNPLNVLFSAFVPSFSQSLRQCALVQDRIHLARIAIALERHFKVHGSYPATLAEMDSRFLPAGGIPKDVVNGTLPHYRKITDQTFTVYYEGWNATDEGGNPHYSKVLKNTDAALNDWVWPAPAQQPGADGTKSVGEK